MGIAKLRLENAEPNYGLQIPPEYDRKMSNVGRDVDYVPPPPAQPFHFAPVLSCKKAHSTVFEELNFMKYMVSLFWVRNMYMLKIMSDFIDIALSLFDHPETL